MTTGGMHSPRIIIRVGVELSPLYPSGPRLGVPDIAMTPQPHPWAQHSAQSRLSHRPFPLSEAACMPAGLHSSAPSAAPRIRGEATVRSYAWQESRGRRLNKSHLPGPRRWEPAGETLQDFSEEAAEGHDRVLTCL